MASHLIQGREVTMPVEVRSATVCAATYLVRADAARAVLAYSGLDVIEPLPGKAVCSLAFVRYDDGDLGEYHEFAVAFLIRPPSVSAGKGRLRGLRELLTGRVGAFIHWLPVNQGFTMEAGRRIWGLPKELADIDLRLASPYKRCVLRRDDRLVLDMLIRPGLPVPGGGGSVLEAYSHRDGVTRRTPWRLRAEGVRVRPGGALIRLGNHAIAKELSELGLPKHALASVSARRVRMTFNDAVILR